jgi:hypothetical protein
MFLYCHNLEGFLTYLYSLEEDVVDHDLKHTGDNKSESHRDSNHSRKQNSKLAGKRSASVKNSAATRAAESDDEDV